MDFGQLTRPFKEIYEHRTFPFIWLFGFVAMSAISSDTWWIIPGIIGFGYFIWRRGI